VETRPCQILITIATTVLARRDVIRLMTLDCLILMKTAILATIAGSLGSSLALGD